MSSSPRITTISSKSPLSNTRGPSQSKATVSLTRLNMTPELAKDPHTVAKAFGDLQESALRATEAARSNPYNAVHILRNQSLTSGTQVNLVHSLGVPWQRAEIVAAGIGSLPMQLIRATPPTGSSPSSTCSVIPYGQQSGAGSIGLLAGVATITTPSGFDFAGVTIALPGGTIGYQYQVKAHATIKNAFVITSLNSGGTLNNADVSIVSYMYTKISSGQYDLMISA